MSDPAAQKALRAAFDLINDLVARVVALEAAVLDTTLDAANNRIVNVADPTANTDAVNRRYLQTYLAAQLEAFK